GVFRSDRRRSVGQHPAIRAGGAGGYFVIAIGDGARHRAAAGSLAKVQDRGSDHVVVLRFEEEPEQRYSYCEYSVCREYCRGDCAAFNDFPSDTVDCLRDDSGSLRASALMALER